MNSVSDVLGLKSCVCDRDPAGYGSLKFRKGVMVEDQDSGGKLTLET